MIKIITTGILLLAAFICKAQVSETRNVSGFSKIEVSTGIELIFTQSNSQSIKVTTDSTEKLEKIKTEIQGKTLKIFVGNKGNYHSKNCFEILKVEVSQDNIDSFMANSGASITIQNEINAPKITIDINSGASFSGNIKSEFVDLKTNSGAKFTGNIETNAFEGDFESAANITLSGNSKTTKIISNSASNCDAKNFITEKANITADSAASVSITATQSLQADASSIALINYYGTPSNVTTNTCSLGKIIKK